MVERARAELILGGQKSGKSRRAEQLAQAWLALGDRRRAVLVATAQPGDPEMCERIARHQRDRAERVPGLIAVEAPLQLGAALREQTTPATLVIVDCLTLWLTNWLMPLDGSAGDEAVLKVAQQDLLESVVGASGPIVLVSNEIGLGVIPMGREVRAYVDALGALNQAVAAVCDRVTLMAAGLPLALKGHECIL